MYRLSVYITKIPLGMLINEKYNMWTLTECKSNSKKAGRNGSQNP